MFFVLCFSNSSFSNYSSLAENMKINAKMATPIEEKVDQNLKVSLKREKYSVQFHKNYNKGIFLVKSEVIIM